MGFFDFLKGKDDPEPTLTIAQAQTEEELQQELQTRQKAFDDYREQMLSGELGNEFGAGKGQEQIDELDRLGGLLNETKDKLGGRDARDLGRTGGLGAGSVAGGAMAGGNALASGVAGAGGLGLAGETLSEQKPFSSSGQLGGGMGNLAGMGGMTGQPLVPKPAPPPPQADLDIAPDQTTVPYASAENRRGRGGGIDDPQAQQTPTQANAPANTDPAEHSIQITASSKADPFIEGGKENPVDVSIFRQFLHIGAEYAFQYAKEQSGVAPIVDIAQRFAPFELKDVVNLAVNAVGENKLTDIGSLRGTKPDRIKLLIKDAELQEHAIINNAVLYPLLVVSFKFYLADRDITTLKPSMMPDFVFKEGFIHILKKFVKLEDTKIRFFVWCWENTPMELINAYKKNRQAITQIPQQDGVVIKKFVERIHEEYNRIFSPNTFLKDMKRYEHGGLELNQMLINLANPTFLFEVGQVYDGVDEFILNIQNNSGFLMGMMGLMYSFARNDGTTMGDALLGNARVDGIVYYNGSIHAGNISNIEVELLKGATEPVSVREVDGTSYIIFRGTDFRGGNAGGEFMKNILNVAGSNELFSNSQYNSRLEQATQELIKLQAEGKRVKIIAYSLGTIFASRLSALFPRVPASLYSPVLADNENTQEFMEKYSNQNPNVEFFGIENDPISMNLQKYKDKFRIKYTNKSRFFDNHKLENYLFNN